jgi:hypothetical protein
MCLKGEVGVAVLSLFLSKDSSGARATVYTGYLSVHRAAMYSSLDVLKLLHKAYPESLSTLIYDGSNILHDAFLGKFHATTYSYDIVNMRNKVEYLCDQCPALIHQKDNNGKTPLHHSLVYYTIHMEPIICLCDIDETVVRDKCTPPDTNDLQSGQLPLHLFIAHNSFSELSKEGDCLRLFLRLYPASGGIKDDYSRSPYDLAVSQDLSAYFLRLLLSADPTIDPVERHNLNFAARRDGMFLAFRALSTNKKPTIWAKIRYEDKYLLAHVISYL